MTCWQCIKPETQTTLREVHAALRRKYDDADVDVFTRGHAAYYDAHAREVEAYWRLHRGRFAFDEEPTNELTDKLHLMLVIAGTLNIQGIRDNFRPNCFTPPLHTTPHNTTSSLLSALFCCFPTFVPSTPSSSSPSVHPPYFSTTIPASSFPTPPTSYYSSPTFTPIPQLCPFPQPPHYPIHPLSILSVVSTASEVRDRRPKLSFHGIFDYGTTTTTSDLHKRNIARLKLILALLPHASEVCFCVALRCNIDSYIPSYTQMSVLLHAHVYALCRCLVLILVTPPPRDKPLPSFDLLAPERTRIEDDFLFDFSLYESPSLFIFGDVKRKKKGQKYSDVI